MQDTKYLILTSENEVTVEDLARIASGARCPDCSNESMKQPKGRPQDLSASNEVMRRPVVLCGIGT